MKPSSKSAGSRVMGRPLHGRWDAPEPGGSTPASIAPVSKVIFRRQDVALNVQCPAGFQCLLLALTELTAAPDR